MANQEQLYFLKLGSAYWNQWRQTYPEIRPDLSKANLSFADLRRIDLRQADLSFADLSSAKLEGTSLKEADLSLA
ncbi:MAG: pentapeptide repeat-containing protein, partial [Ktedonobacteraceae bacterium]